MQIIKERLELPEAKQIIEEMQDMVREVYQEKGYVTTFHTDVELAFWSDYLESLGKLTTLACDEVDDNQIDNIQSELEKIIKIDKIIDEEIENNLEKLSPKSEDDEPCSEETETLYNSMF